MMNFRKLRLILFVGICVLLTPGITVASTPVLFSGQISVSQFRFIGNTVFSAQDLAQLTAPYQNKTVSFEDLEDIRHKLTKLYVDNGYISSGAVIPEQNIENNSIVFQIIEGQLSDIIVNKNDHLRSSYISCRIRLDAGPPLNINKLQERIQLLHDDPMIRRLDAELGPGLRLGESEMKVRVEEEKPYQIGFQFANNRPPSVGAYQGKINAAYRSLTGWGDTLGIEYGITQGLDDFSVYYFVPVTPRDTAIKIYYEKSSSAVIETPFDVIDIKSDSETGSRSFQTDNLLLYESINILMRFSCIASFLLKESVFRSVAGHL